VPGTRTREVTGVGGNSTGLDARDRRRQLCLELRDVARGENTASTALPAARGKWVDDLDLLGTGAEGRERVDERCSR
jgi:hypothetical protein